MSTSATLVELPLKVERWIPTLHNAPREELKKYEISQNRALIIWDPNKCAINDELRIADYLGSYSESA